jgi:hypothetical protein
MFSLLETQHGNKMWDSYGHRGTAMGTPPAPPYATLYFAIHKDTLLDEFDTDLIFYKRFYDDCIGVWNPSVDPNADAICWQAFQDQMNAFPGLTWEITRCGPTLDFMDLTLSIRHDRIYTTLLDFTSSSRHILPTCLEFFPA